MRENTRVSRLDRIYFRGAKGGYGGGYVDRKRSNNKIKSNEKKSRNRKFYDFIKLHIHEIVRAQNFLSTKTE